MSGLLKTIRDSYCICAHQYTLQPLWLHNLVLSGCTITQLPFKIFVA